MYWVLVWSTGMESSRQFLRSTLFCFRITFFKLHDWERFSPACSALGERTSRLSTIFKTIINSGLFQGFLIPPYHVVSKQMGSMGTVRHADWHVFVIGVSSSQCFTFPSRFQDIPMSDKSFHLNRPCIVSFMIYWTIKGLAHLDSESQYFLGVSVHFSIPGQSLLGRWFSTLASVELSTLFQKEFIWESMGVKH